MLAWLPAVAFFWLLQLACFAAAAIAAASNDPWHLCSPAVLVNICNHLLDLLLLGLKAQRPEAASCRRGAKQRDSVRQ
jgi:hypothetical protein